MRRILIALGIVVAAFGVLFILQGLGWVHWPKSSFMIGRSEWVDRGAVIAVVGLVLVIAGRRLR